MNVSVKFHYLHAERIGDPPPGTQMQLNVQINVDTARYTKRHDSVEAPFTVAVSTTPAVITVTVRGVLSISGDVDRVEESFRKGMVPPEISAVIFQMGLCEAALLTRELGLPPPMPVPEQKQKGGGGPIYA